MSKRLIKKKIENNQIFICSICEIFVLLQPFMTRRVTCESVIILSDLFTTNTAEDSLLIVYRQPDVVQTTDSTKIIKTVLVVLSGYFKFIIQFGQPYTSSSFNLQI